MKRFVWAAVAALVVVSFAVPAIAQETGAKFATHVQAHAGKAAFICGQDSPNDSTTGDPVACTDYVTTWGLLSGADLYVVIAQADSEGVGAASFGIEYDNEAGSGIDISGFEECITGLPFYSDDPKWPASGSGARLTWLLPDNCQDQNIGSDGVHAVVGAFYVYAYTADRFIVTPNRTLLSGPELAITNCAGAAKQFDINNVQRGGIVTFGDGSDPGCNPCVDFCPTPVEKSTWGKIKNRYVRN